MPKLTSNPQKFALLFNRMVPGAYRKLTVDDVRKLTELGLVGRYGYYCSDDRWTVIGILQWEQYREGRGGMSARNTSHDHDQRTCKGCSKPLPPLADEVRPGRRGEYCRDCEPYRLRLRKRRSREKKKMSQKIKQKFG